MTYSRENPSARYKDLLEQYQQLHTDGEKLLGLSPEETFPGASLRPHISKIKQLIDKTGAETILDYGSGKGLQYEPIRVDVKGVGTFSSIMDYWDVESVHCYDPCYSPYQKLPQEKFDGVICTDVLEHCPEEDMPWILEELFRYANMFVYANVACYPAEKHLPSGENAHCTVKPAEWWKKLLKEISEKYPNILWEVYLSTKKEDQGNTKIIEERLSNIS